MEHVFIFGAHLKCCAPSEPERKSAIYWAYGIWLIIYRTLWKIIWYRYFSIIGCIIFLKFCYDNIQRILRVIKVHCHVINEFNGFGPKEILWIFLSWREYNDIILPFTEGKSISDLVLVQISSHKPEPHPDIINTCACTFLLTTYLTHFFPVLTNI